MNQSCLERLKLEKNVLELEDPGLCWMQGELVETSLSTLKLSLFLLKKYTHTVKCFKTN